jgi:hypothetical protein
MVTHYHGPEFGNRIFQNCSFFLKEMAKGTESLKSFLCRGPEQANIQSPETGLPQV